MRISDWSSDVCSSDLVPENILRGVDGYVVQPIRSVLISHAGGEAIFLIKERQVGDPLRCSGKGDFAPVRSLKIAISERNARLRTKAIKGARQEGKGLIIGQFDAVELAVPSVQCRRIGVAGPIHAIEIISVIPDDRR